MRFDPDKYVAIKPGEEVKMTSGIIDVRATHPVNVFLTSDSGAQALAGTGHNVSINVPNNVVVSIRYPGKAGEAFLYSPTTRHPEKRQEVFTSADLAPHAGQHSQVIAQITRQIALEQQSKRFRQERRRQEQEADARRDLVKAAEDGDETAEEMLKLHDKHNEEDKSEDKKEIEEVKE